MSVDASHRLMVELSMQEGEFTQGIAFANAALDTFRKNIKKMAAESSAAMAKMEADTAKLAATVKAQATAQAASAAAIKRTTAVTRAAGEETRTTFTKVLDLANRNKVAWNQTANRIAFAGAAMVAVFGAVTIGYARFEQAIDQATAVIEVSVYDMQRLTAAALEAGRTTQFTAIQAAEGIEALAKAGVSAVDIYSGALAGAVNLAAAGGISLGEAAETAAIMMIQFGKSGKDVTHIADLLAAAAGKAVGDVHDLVMALKQGGLIASQFGLSMEDTASTLALFAQNGLLGSDAGTSLKIMLLRLAAPATRAQKEMAKLGISAWDANGAFVGMEKFAGILQAKLGGLTQQEQDHALSVIFGTDAMRSAAIMLKEGAKGYKAMSEAVNDDGFAWEVMRKRMDNLSGDVKRLGGAWDSLVASAGQGSNSSLRVMTQQLTGFVNAIGRMDPAELNAVVQTILGIGGAGLAVAGLMKLVIGLNNFRKALSSSDGLLSGFLGNIKGLPKIAFAAGAALAALGVAQTISAQNTERLVGSVEQLEASLMRIAKSKSIDGLRDKLNEVFAGSGAPGNGLLAAWDQVSKVDSLQLALERYRMYANDMTGLFRFTQDHPIFANSQENSIALLKQYDEAFGALVANGNLDQATTAFQQFADSMEAQNFSAEEMRRAFPLLYNSMVSYANQLGVGELSTEEYVAMMRGDFPVAVSIAIAHQNELNGTFNRTGLAAEDAATKVRESVMQMAADLKTALDPLQARSDFEAAIDDTKEMILQKLNERDANNKLTDSAKDYRREIKKLGADWPKNLNFGAGRDIFSGAKQIATTGMASLQQDLPNLDAAEVQKRIAKINTAIRNYATAAGLGEAATQALIDEIGLIPESVETTFASPGMNVSKQQAQDLQTAIANLPELAQVKVLAPGARPSKEQVDEFMSSLDEMPPEKESVIRTIAELGGVAEAQTAYDNLKDKDSWIHTSVDKTGVWWWTDYQPESKTAWIITKAKNGTGAPRGNVKRAQGGTIPGYSPTPYADNIPVMATAGEYMQPVASVRYYGEAFMERLRRRLIPRNMIQHLASGGQVEDRRYVPQPMRIVTDRSTSVDNSRGPVSFDFPNARFGATPSEMIGAFGFAVNSRLASVGF